MRLLGEPLYYVVELTPMDMFTGDETSAPELRVQVSRRTYTVSLAVSALIEILCPPPEAEDKPTSRRASLFPWHRSPPQPLPQ